MTDDRNKPPSHPPPRARNLEEAVDRIQALETRLLIYENRTNARLNHGAETFMQMERSLGELKPKRLALLPWVAVAIAIGGVVFRAGTYPTREELDRLNERVIDQIEAFRAELRNQERELIRSCSSPLESQEERLNRLELRFNSRPTR